MTFLLLTRAPRIYQLKFITAGTYQFFLRQSLYDSNNNNSFLNEDSIFLPPEFNKNSGFDWIGFARPAIR